MGYTTSFTGVLNFSRPLTLKEAAIWMKHVDAVQENQDEPERNPSWPESGYLQWVPTGDLTGMVWDGEEKFTDWEDWLTWVVDTILKPWRIVANGEMIYQGEDAEDRGKIYMVNNQVTVERGTDKIGRAEPLTSDALKDMLLAEMTKE